ncbi:MAG TPA: YqiA/YcfP family alpha/beta fold hydrolase [Noviherbaspirillum sp.]|nr:YqiA/YcfP family alpha/beta fold hydrolase [Noviherbaspirillum sp.]
MAQTPLVHFIHGKESGPRGRKIIALAEVARGLGYAVESLDYSGTMDPGRRLEMLLQACAALEAPLVLVGSSMGGWVAAEAATRIEVAGVFLLAPALFMPSYPSQQPVPIRAALEIVHGWGDDVIPVDHSIRFAQAARCALHLLDADHRLNDCIPTLEGLFRQFLERLQEQVAAGGRA